MDLIKQNKNYIGLLMNSFRKNSRTILGVYDGSYRDVHLDSIRSYPSGNIRSFKLYFNLQFMINNVPVWDIIYFVHGNCIYFGYDLSKPLRLEKTENLIGGHTRSFNNLFNYIRWGNEDKFDDIFKGMKGPHGFEYTKDDLESDKDLLLQTDEYKEIVQLTTDISKKAQVTAKLSDKAFPRLNRRDVIPFAWIDTGKGTINFSTKPWVKVHTQGIEKVPTKTFFDLYGSLNPSYISTMVGLLEFTIDLNGSFNDCRAVGTNYSQWRDEMFSFKK